MMIINSIDRLYKAFLYIRNVSKIWTKGQGNSYNCVNSTPLFSRATNYNRLNPKDTTEKPKIWKFGKIFGMF